MTEPVAPLPPCGCKRGCEHREHPEFPEQRTCRLGYRSGPLDGLPAARAPRAGQDGPVQLGRTRPGPPPMDPDVAVAMLADRVVTVEEGRIPEREAATAALLALVHAARAYVRGQSPGRLEQLAALLQEPVGPAVDPVDPETVVQAYLTERNLVVMPVEAARVLGFRAPS